MALNWTQIIMAAAGTVGFSLIFRLRARYVPLTAVVGALGWAVYLITQQMFQSASVFLPALTGGFAAAISSEILARVMKAPSTLFFLHHLDGAADSGQHALLLHGCHCGGGKGSSPAVWHDHVSDRLRHRNGDEYRLGDLQSHAPCRRAEREQSNIELSADTGISLNASDDAAGAQHSMNKNLAVRAGLPAVQRPAVSAGRHSRQTGKNSYKIIVVIETYGRSDFVDGQILTVCQKLFCLFNSEFPYLVCNSASIAFP